MAKFNVLLAAAALATAGIASAAAPVFTVNYSTATPVPSNNDFQSQLAGLGLTQYTTEGPITISGRGRVTFEFLGSESGFSDTFTSGAVTYTEHSSYENHFDAPIALGSYKVGPGALSATFSGGDLSNPGDFGFGVFLPGRLTDRLAPNTTLGYSSSVMYFGYDDTRFGDDNHDDFVVRATLSGAPEAATWAMMIAGFAMVGVAARHRRIAVA